MPRHAVDERELETTRAEGDTASRAVAINRSFGSELLQLHIARYDPGRSRPRTLEGEQEVIYAVEGQGTLIVGGAEHRLEPMTAAYVVAGETYEVDNRGPETLLLVSAIAPQADNGPHEGPRTVRYEDQESLPASGGREFRYLVTHEVGC